MKPYGMSFAVYSEKSFVRFFVRRTYYKKSCLYIFFQKDIKNLFRPFGRTVVKGKIYRFTALASAFSALSTGTKIAVLKMKTIAGKTIRRIFTTPYFIFRKSPSEKVLG